MIRGILIGIFIMFEAATLYAQSSDGTAQPAQQVQSAAQNIAGRTTDTFNKIRDQGLPPGTIIAWIVVGALAGIVAGGVFRRNAGAVGVLTNLVLGGIGAFVGGFIVRVLGLDFGWPVISFKSESLLLALVLSFALVLIYRGLVRRVHKATSEGPTTTRVVNQ